MKSERETTERKKDQVTELKKNELPDLRSKADLLKQASHYKLEKEKFARLEMETRYKFYTCELEEMRRKYKSVLGERDNLQRKVVELESRGGCKNCEVLERKVEGMKKVIDGLQSLAKLGF